MAAITINPGDTVKYTFTTKADLSAEGNYIFDAWTSLGLDSRDCDDSTTNYQIFNGFVQNVCIFDADGGAGDTTCSNFTNSLCTDGWISGDTTLKLSNSFSIPVPKIDSVEYDLYITGCAGDTVDFSLYFNGVQIGTFTDSIITCTCTPSQYPLKIVITDTAALNALLNDCGPNWLGVKHNGLTMNVSGYTATIYSRCDTSSGSGIKVNLNVFLEGAYQGSNTMSADLYAAGLLDQYLDGGSASINMNPSYSIPSDTSGNAVDVIIIQLRTGTSSATAVDTLYAWLMQDGSIRDFETGQKPFASSCSAPTGNYYIVVMHRNHLNIMYSDLVALDNTPPPPVDLTNVINIYGGGIGSLGDGPYGMWAANARNSDQEVNGNDLYDVSIHRDILLPGYNLTDVDLSGVVNASDFDIASDNNDQLYWSTVP